jgi:hypothetical protein
LTILSELCTIGQHPSDRLDWFARLRIGVTPFNSPLLRAAIHRCCDVGHTIAVPWALVDQSGLELLGWHSAEVFRRRAFGTSIREAQRPPRGVLFAADRSGRLRRND